MDKRWLAVEIGCLECGIPTDVRGTFATEQEAREAFGPRQEVHLRGRMSDKPFGDWHGDVLCVIYDLEKDSIGDTD